MCYISDKPVMLVARVDERISGLTFDPVYGRVYWTELKKHQSVLFTDSNGNKLTTLYKNRESARNIVSCSKTGLVESLIFILVFIRNIVPQKLHIKIWSMTDLLLRP